MPTRDVLVLCEYPTLHGGEHSFLSVAPYLQAAGFNIRVAAPPEGPFAEACRSLGLEVTPFDSATGEVKQAVLRERLAKLLQTRRPDLLHANSLSMSRLSGPVAAELKIPSIGHLRDIVGLSRAAVEDINLHHRIIAVSDTTRQFHIAQGLDESRCIVCHNGVDLVKFALRLRSGELRRELQIDENSYLIGAVGQLVRRKGFDILAAAAPAILEKVPNAHFVFVGECHSAKDEAIQFASELRKSFSAPPHEGRAQFLDARGDMPELYNEFDLLVHPARQEPLGRVLLEAAASGLPVVATNVGGTLEIFPPAAAAAVLVPPDDPQALADAVARVATDHIFARRIGDRARRCVEDAFDVKDAAARLAVHYREVMGVTA